MDQGGAGVNNTLNDYRAIQKTFGLPELAETSLAITETRVSDHAALIKTLVDFKPQHGWYIQQSANHLVEPEMPFDFNDPDGFLLEAELARGEASLRVRGDGAGGWCVTTLEADKGGQSAFCQESRQIGRGGKVLVHHVYWTHSDIYGWRPSASRLVRIDKDANDV
jgi:hypothetical protein